MIPQEIREHPYWCVRKEKIPYNPKTGNMAKPNDPTTFGTYEEAKAVVERYSGFGVSLREGLSAVDIDHCITDGELSDTAQTIVKTFHSYTETSPSGEGIRILFRSPGVVYDKERYYFKNTKLGVELYLSGQTERYVTVTGNTLEDSALCRSLTQEEVNDFAEQYMKRPKKEKPTSSQKSECSLSDMDILEKAQEAKNGAEFTALYRGDWSNYQSQSEADLAFCNMLAFWCCCDYAKMDSIFRQSGLCRSKWDEKHGDKTYGEMTLSKAIDDCMNTYEGYKQKDGEGEPKEWSKPIPLDEEILPPFPIDCLPLPVRQYVEAVAEAVQVPLDMAAIAALVTAALCVQKKFLIKGKENWLEPLNLYAVVVAPPAERKSAVMQSMTKFVYDYEQLTNEFLQNDIDHNKMERNILTQAVKTLEGKAAKGVKGITTEEVFKKQQELTELEVVKPIRFLADDCTPEVLVSLLAENGGKMAVVSAEGGIFEILNGRYSQSVNIDVFLKAHSGDTIRVDRKGRASEYVPHPALSVLLAIQPVVLNGLMTNDSFRGRGLTARFLYCIPQSTVGNRSFDTPCIPQQYELGFKAVINGLLAIPQESKPPLIKLSPEAHNLSAEFAAELEPRLRGDLENIGDWAGKLHGAILRIAGVLHAAENREECANTLLAAQTIKWAITIGRYLLEHAKAAYSLMGADEQIQGAKYILRQLEKQQYTEISKSEMTRLGKNKFKKSTDMNPALELLEEYGYIRKGLREYGGYGRKPESNYYINPLFYNQ